jgi:electron transfer flavoprotein alpha subunit
MSAVLIVAEHNGNELNAATARCVTCAASLPAARITVVVFAGDAASAERLAGQAAALQGVQAVLAIGDAVNAPPLAAVLAPQIVALAAGFELLLGPATTFGKDLMPRVAALLDAPQVSDICALESARRFRRPIHAGNVIATIEAGEEPHIVGTVRTASFQAAAGGNGAPVTVLARADIPLPTHTRFVELAAPKSDRPDLQSAARVVSGGRGFASAENFQLLYRLAGQLGAAVGASRAAVDAGFAPNDMQVGQTGKIIAPDLYVAVGISGAIQHLTGIKDARTIVAINKDAEAPIFEVADLGLVGDLFKLLPEIEAALRG